MVALQVSNCLSQVVRLNKIAEISVDLQSLMKALSLKEAGAVKIAFHSSFDNTKGEKMVSWM